MKKKSAWCKTMKKEWIRKHIVKISFSIGIILGAYVIGAMCENYIIIAGNTIFAFFLYIIFRNEMLTFIENNINQDKRD